MFTRDNLVWSITFVGALAAFAASHTHLVPAPYAEHVHDVASIIGFVSGYLAWSPLPSSPTHANGPWITRFVRAARRSHDD